MAFKYLIIALCLFNIGIGIYGMYICRNAIKKIDEILKKGEK